MAARGKKYSFALAESFAREKSGGVKVDYKNEISIKQNGGMLAKGRLLGLQFLALFEDDLYYDICRAANEQAYRIAAACKEVGFAAKVLQPGEEMTL